jgi:hypothetical protein
MPEIRFWFQWPAASNVNGSGGANKAVEAGGGDIFARACFEGFERPLPPKRSRPPNRQEGATIWPHRRLTLPPAGNSSAGLQGTKMKRTKVESAVMPASWPLRLAFAAAAAALALLAIPHIAHAQGIVRGAQEGSYEGNRVAGPVGGVVGGAVGAGVGGAVGAVEGVFGLPHRGWHCHGYRDSYGRFHCYR